MIFTDKFVCIHEPKTGGTFVTSALYRIHKPITAGRKFKISEYHPVYTKARFPARVLFPLARAINFFRGAHVYDTKYGNFVYWKNKHGTCSQIPEKHQGKTILATVRNPFELYVSEYEFGWWRKWRYWPSYHKLPQFKEIYPQFPNLSFEDYVRFSNYDAGTASDDGLGPFTKRFIRFYFRAPKDVPARIDSDYISSGRYIEDMFAIRFIRTNELNDELYRFLIDMGYEESDVEFVRSHGKVFPEGKNRTDDRHWEKYYNASLKEFVREREHFIFSIFPPFDV